MSVRAVWMVVVAVACVSCILDRSGQLPLGSTSASGGSGAGGSQVGGGQLGGGQLGGGGSNGGGGTGGEAVCDGNGCIELGEGTAVIVSDGSCPDGWSSIAAKFVAVDPGCEACTCGAPSGGSCALSNITTHGGVNCGNGNTVNVSLLSQGECVLLTNGPDSYTTGPSVPSEGSCTANQPLPKAVEQLALCEPSTPLQTCGTTGVCPLPGGRPLCALYPDGATCPATLPVATQLADGSSDDRTCECACGPSPGVSCNGTVMNVFDSGDCSGNTAGTVEANKANCNTIEGKGDQSINLTPGTWAGGPCPATIQRGGSVTFSQRQLLCCSQ